MKSKKRVRSQITKLSQGSGLLDDGSIEYFSRSGIPSHVYGESNLFDYEGHHNCALNLSCWTLILNDDDLSKVVGAQRNRIVEKVTVEKKNPSNDFLDKVYFQDSQSYAPSAKTNSTIHISHNHFESFGLRHIDLSGGDKITDVGLQYLRDCPALRKLNLGNCYRITSAGIRNLVKHCKLLKELDLSGCMGIENDGFRVVGSSLSLLEVIRLSGCGQIQSSSLITIFEGCKMLYEVDVSYCTAVSDYQMKVLSDNCPRLRVLNLQGCHLVSDVSIVALSSNCPDLKKLNLSRNEMPFKISDVCLLALGDYSFNLTDITLCGCEMITDTGISWLVKGCHKLLNIDLTKCAKVTNNGIRLIGKVCKNLKNINLSKLKQITDIGLRHLVEGCNNLEKVNATGLYLLSDGVKRDFGPEGIQAISLSSCSQSLREFNLGGCFRVGTNALRSIGTLCNLRKLSLTGCTSLTFDGIKAIANGCKNICYICLAHCGDCVTDDIVEILGKNLQRLECVILSGCTRVGGRSLAALSTISSLRKLDFSGCIRIDDDALMVLSEGNYRFGLNFISLNECKFITNAGITWIADGQSNACGQSSITTLSLKSTKVSETGLVAVREQFKYSQIKNNASFFGFWPLPRVSDIDYIYKYGKRSKSLEKIQSLCFLFHARKRFAHLRKNNAMNIGVVLLQARWRGIKERRSIFELLRLMGSRWRMSIRIQCFFRVLLAKRILTALEIQKWNREAPTATLLIQRNFRGKRGRVRAKLRHIEQRCINIAREKSCILIQKISRILIAKQTLTDLRTQQFNYERTREACALAIQQFYRGYMALSKLASLRMIANAVMIKKCNSTSVIIKTYRRFYFLSLLEHRMKTRKQCQWAAVVIQTIFRVISAKLTVKLRHQAITQQTRIQKSIVIQAFIRQHASVLYVQNLLKQRNALEALKADKSVLIRRWWRGYLGRRRAQKLRTDSIENMRQILRAHIWAATLLANAWRCKLARSRVLSLRSDSESCAKGWKKIFSKEEQRYFYYNQYTEEIRWRTPPCLLDDERKVPVCSNCAFYEAHVECGVCVEFFCSQCWDAVHFGGKRAHHTFRILFDYYGKRIDYGDGQFPSIWPSEIHSDIT